MPYLPDTVPNIQRPTPDQVRARISSVQEWQEAIARAKAASFCPGNAAYNGNRWATTGDSSGANTGQGTMGGPNYQGGGGAGGSMYDPDGGGGIPGMLSQDQLDEIANAPHVQTPGNEPCPIVNEVACIAKPSPAPPWGNEHGTLPPAICGPTIAQQASEIPWWILLLLAVGGAMVVREVLE